MGELARSNFNRSLNLLTEYDYEEVNKIEKCENSIDKMEEVLTKYLVNLENLDLSSFDTNNVISCDNIWKDIYNLTIKIDESKNKKLLENKPDGIIIDNDTNSLQVLDLNKALEICKREEKII